MPAPAPSSVRVLAGKYALGRPLGEGAAGTVFEAENLLVGRTVAVKVLPPHLAVREDLQTAFISEARAAARVAHANVVEVFDIGLDREGAPFIVMELLAGETLMEILESRGPLPLPYAAELTLQILAAVSAAHEQGIIHRDLKPANVMVTHPRPDQPLVKVLDFGIAQGLVASDDEALRCAGTPLYMPPEQALGKPLDPRSDVYSVCAIFYELVTGRPPFNLDSSEAVLAASLRGRFTPLAQRVPGVHPVLAAAIDSGLSANRNQRPASAAALSEILGPFADPIASSRIRRSARSLEPIPLVCHECAEVAPEPEWQPPPRRGWVAPMLWVVLGFAAGVGVCAGFLSG